MADGTQQQVMMHDQSTTRLHARHLFDGRHWHRDVVLRIDAAGNVASIDADDGCDATPVHLVLPGMINLHSHAFQRAMAGLAEFRSHAQDTFWSWRELMYRIAGRIQPDELQAAARHLYIEMLKAGYTSVCEFHYLHNAPDGQRYADPAELSHRHLEAARSTGIGLTHLPVLYQRGGFDGRPLADHQRRFGLSTEHYLDLLQSLQNQCSDQIRVGAALHSLRAVGKQAAVEVSGSLPAGAPIHVHVAEQLQEVEDCVLHHGRRPVAWLLDELPVDQRWCLVHATHLDEAEISAIARCGAVVGLCPTTEANLGDGLFPLAAFLDAGGRWGIGSDSHVCVDPREELRWLEYGQRLISRRRIVAQGQAQPHVGCYLWTAALDGGAAACGRPVGSLTPGRRADLLVVDPFPGGLAPETSLDRFIFADGSGRIRDVMVGGRWQVRDGRHADEAQARKDFAAVMRRS